MKDLGTLSYFLGLKVTSSYDEYYLFQAIYAYDLLSKANIIDNKTVPLPWNTMQSSHPWMVNLYLILLTIISWLVVWFISLLLVQIFHMPWVWLVSSWMPFILSTMLPFYWFSDMSKAHYIMVYTTPLGLLSRFMLIQRQIGQVIWLIDALSQVFVSCWILLLSRGVARSKMLFPIPVLRLSIMPLSTPHASLSGFTGFWLIWMLYSPLSLLFIVTIVVLSTLLIMMSSMNAPSTWRSTATSLANISRKAISSCSSSPLLTSLLISSPRVIRLVVFEILYPKSSWLPPYHLEFEGGDVSV